MSEISRMDLFNEVEITGQVGRDPEIGAFQDGRRYAEFTVIIRFSYYNDKDELVEQQLRQHVVFWQKKLVGVIERRVSKGMAISISGRLSPRSFLDAAGEKQFRTMIVGKRLKIL